MTGEENVVVGADAKVAEPPPDVDPNVTRFTTVLDENAAGVGSTDESQHLYMREEFKSLGIFVGGIVAANCLGFVDGLPGTGTSTAVLWSLQQPAYTEKKVVWVHFSRDGLISSVAVKEKGVNRFIDVDGAPTSIDGAGSYDINADILVYDGAKEDTFLLCKDQLRNFWRNGENKKAKCGLITMSSKIKRNLGHELKMLEAKQKKGTGVGEQYRTTHSWILDEYKKAFLFDDGKRTPVFVQNRAIFEKEWEIEAEADTEGEEDMQQRGPKRSRDGRKKMASVEEIIEQKYAYAGGSARWMNELTTKEIDNEIIGWIMQSDDALKLLSFSLGPQSSLAKTHLFSSFFDQDSGLTKFAMVSERATQLLVDKCGQNGIKSMYTHASALKNPSFLGWVVEADLFDRVKSGELVLLDKDQKSKTIVKCQRGAPIEFDYGYLLQLRLEDDNTSLVDEVEKLIPDNGLVRTCKPKAWNQGGFDVVFIEVEPDGENRIHVRFGQVTKSDSHSLNLKYFAEFLRFFGCIDCEILSVEIAFIVPWIVMESFRILPSKVKESGLLGMYTRYGTPETEQPEEKQKNRWTKRQEQEQVSLFGLDMEGMGYPTTF